MKAEMYSKSNCPYCVSAKRLLEDSGIDFIETTLDQSNRDALIERVKGATITSENPEGIFPKTVPQIFIDDQYIGGFDQLSLYFART